jgi:hypothetical protein
MNDKPGGMMPVMNDTKWDELRLEMYNLDEMHPRFRTRWLSNGYVSPWDGEWFYHFRERGYAGIEWVEIRTVSTAQCTAVLNELRRIHVPGCQIDDGFRVYGYLPDGTRVDYI